MGSPRSPPRGTTDLEVAAVPLSPSGAGELRVTAGGAPPVPAASPQASPHLLASPRLQGLHIQPGAPPARGAGSRPLQPAGPGPIDAHPVDEELLRALVLQLGLDRADELPELWLGQHELDSPADRPAGC